MSNKYFWASKTKWAGILGGLTLMAPSVISWLSGGSLNLAEVWQGFLVILGVFGVRDALDNS